MSAIEKNSFVWASLGIEPPIREDAIYEAGEQPIAGFDNYVNWMITSDIDALNEYAGNHGSEHEAGGGQEIDLSGLSIGNAGRLVGNNAVDETEVRIEQNDGSGSAAVRIDMDGDAVRAWPDFAIRPTFGEGLTLGQHLYRGGDVIYDYNDDRFHRAEHALEANVAELAEDSDALEGNPASAFIREEDAAVNPTGDWNFEEIVDTDIHGNATTANYADEAEHAARADSAEQADNAELHEGFTVQEILDMVSGDIADSFPAVDDDGVEQTNAATRFDFGQSIDVSTTGSTAEMSVDSVPHSQESEFAYNSDRLDNYEASDLISMMGSGGRWNQVGSWQFTEDDGFVWHYDLADNDEVYDFYRLSLVHEYPHHNKSNRAIALQINEDTRNRYNYRYSTYNSHREPEVFHGVRTGGSSFPLCVAPGTKRAVAEYQISGPARIGSAGDIENEDIYVGRVGNGVYPKTYPLFLHGALNTSHETITDLRLFANNNQINVSIGLWGRNITR